MSKPTDINDLAKSGALPADPAKEAKPVNQKAREEAEEAARLVSLKSMLEDSAKRAFLPRQETLHLTTGHWEMDQDTGGFRRGCVWVFGAKSSWGKSSHLLMAADENIKRGKRVLIVSAEDPKDLYADRWMVRRARVSRYRFQNQSLDVYERDKIHNVIRGAEDVPVYLSAIGKGVEWAAKKVRQIIKAEGIDLVAWDYLHAFDNEKPMKDRRSQLNYIARTMTDCTKTADVAGIIYAQITPDEKASGPPDMYVIRDTKDVVNAAEVVAVGFDASGKEKRGDQFVAEPGARVVILAKNKPGPGAKGRIYAMKSDNTHGCFDVTEKPSTADDYFG